MSNGTNNNSKIVSPSFARKALAQRVAKLGKERVMRPLPGVSAASVLDELQGLDTVEGVLAALPRY